jgi:hypothetical protein
MKKNIYILLLIMFGVLSAQQTKAGAFEKGNKLISVDLAATNYIHFFGGGYYTGYYGYYSGLYSPVSGHALMQMEFAPGRYVGAGFGLGIGGSAYGWAGGELSVPVFGFCNFHFFQLIADKVKHDIHGDKFDIYAGLTAGSGIAFYPGTSSVRPILVIGPHVGFRYYFRPTLGVHAEVGYGTQLIGGGLTFKLGGGGGSAKSSKATKAK